MNQPKTNQLFAELGISPSFLAVLTKLGFTTPTPIQHKAIPVAASGKDVIGIAQTGTGKTMAFGIPMIQRLAVTKGQGLILVPTRELALQVEEVLKKIGGPLGLRTVALIGGMPMNRQLAELKKKVHIIIATPGRLLDHVEHKTVLLSTIHVAVLDEADRMFDMGFAPQMKQVLNALPKERQIMLFSATMPREIVSLATSYMRLPLQIEVAPPGTTVEKIEQEFFMVRKEDKVRLLETLLNQYKGSVLVFSRTKHGAKKICQAVIAAGFKAAELHSNRSLNQRKQALSGFKSGHYRVMVATDIAARGIDVSNIELVINFDIPEDPEDYVHRIGRTGRAGRLGKAISFVMPDQKNKLRDIERLTRKRFTVSVTPALAAARVIPPSYRSIQNRRSGFGKNNARSQSENRFNRTKRESSRHDSSTPKPHRDAKRGQRGRRSRRPAHHH